MPKVSLAREDHRDARRVRRGDDDRASFTEPPGWTTAVTPAPSSTSRPSGNGKNASDAATAPFARSPGLADRVPAGVHAARAAAADAVRRGLARDDDPVRDDAAQDAVREAQRARARRRRRALRDDFPRGLVVGQRGRPPARGGPRRCRAPRGAGAAPTSARHGEDAQVRLFREDRLRVVRRRRGRRSTSRKRDVSAAAAAASSVPVYGDDAAEAGDGIRRPRGLEGVRHRGRRRGARGNPVLHDRERVRARRRATCRAPRRRRGSCCTRAPSPGRTRSARGQAPPRRHRRRGTPSGAGSRRSGASAARAKESDSRSGNVSPVSAENQRAIAASYAAVRRKTFAARRRRVSSLESAAVLRQLGGDGGVVRGIADDADVRVVLRGRAQQGRPADVDLLDGFREGRRPPSRRSPRTDRDSRRRGRWARRRARRPRRGRAPRSGRTGCRRRASGAASSRGRRRPPGSR